MALVKVDFFSTSLMRKVTFQALIPCDKPDFPGIPKRENKPFKTLYLLHGIMDNCTDWASGTRIQRWAQDKDLAVIMPSGENHFYVDNEMSGERYGEYIGKELVEFTRKLFPLSDKREDTFISGLSMGGFGALVNGLKYYDTFGSIAALSSALIADSVINSSNDTSNPFERRGYYESVFGDLNKLIGSDKDYQALAIRMKEEATNPTQIYMACGVDDSFIEQNRDYYNFLSKQKIDVRYEEGPGAHEWDFWDTYIKKALDWLPLD